MNITFNDVVRIGAVVMVAAGAGWLLASRSAFGRAMGILVIAIALLDVQVWMPGFETALQSVGVGTGGKT